MPWVVGHHCPLSVLLHMLGLPRAGGSCTELGQLFTHVASGIFIEGLLNTEPHGRFDLSGFRYSAHLVLCIGH